MARQVPQRRTSTAVAVLVASLLLAAPASAVAAPAGVRPPTHAGEGQAPPPHARSPAPEERPPAHARARRASARHTGDARTGDEPVSTTSPDRSSRGRPSAPPPHAAPRAAAPRGDGPPDGAPAHGNRGRTTDDADPGTELDTDRVVVGPAPVPDRAPLAGGGPVLPAPPPLALVAAPVLGVTPATPFGGAGAAADDPADAGAGGTDAGAGGGEDAGSARDPLAAPRTRSVAPLFGTPELTRRVVVPVVVLVAGLVYLLAQGRIDRRGELLLAPPEPGTEHDDDVYDL